MSEEYVRPEGSWVALVTPFDSTGNLDLDCFKKLVDFQVANGTDYALTGGIYSRSPAHLERVRQELEVGNLYLNRHITGALVGRQPFGGFKLSGVGSKAGGGGRPHSSQRLNTTLGSSSLREIGADS